MKYNSEQIQDKFHKLAVDLQVAVNELEDKLAELGYTVTIADIKDGDKQLDIIVRVAN